MPAGEDLATLGRGGATLAIHLSIMNLDQVSSQLLPLYGEDCPIIVVFRASWPDERILRHTVDHRLDGQGIGYRSQCPHSGCEISRPVALR
jgi:precorrin-4 methylase